MIKIPIRKTQVEAINNLDCSFKCLKMRYDNIKLDYVFF